MLLWSLSIVGGEIEGGIGWHPLIGRLLPLPALGTAAMPCMSRRFELPSGTPPLLHDIALRIMISKRHITALCPALCGIRPSIRG